MSASDAEFRIRRMTAADVDGVLALAEGLKDAPHWAAPAYMAAVDPEGVRRRIALVAEDAQNGAVAGFAVAGLVMPLAELETIAVAAEGQRRGVGRRLLARLTEELRAAGVTEVILEVRGSNGAALALYRGQGFAETGRRVRYYADPVEDAVLMGRRLA
jgi:[ribosomal protein S18]-alanine N-acetyltransferase